MQTKLLTRKYECAAARMFGHLMDQNRLENSPQSIGVFCKLLLGRNPQRITRPLKDVQAGIMCVPGFSHQEISGSIKQTRSI